MKKIFTLAAAILASISLWAETANLTATTGVNFAAKDYTWPDVAKNKVLYDAATNPQIMAWSNGNAISFDTSNGMKIGNSSKESAVVFRVASKSNITVNVGRNGSDVTVQLLYLGESTDVLTSSNLAPGTATKCDEVAISSSSATGALEYTGNAGYYKIYGNPRFCVKDISVAEACTNPEFTVSPTEGTGFVGDPIEITVTSKNQSKPINPAVTVNGKAAVYGTDYTFSATTGLVQATPLKAGKFEITFSQASNGTYCDAKETVTFVISAKNPVTTVTVAGPTAGVIGQELTYTATAEGATAYEWYLDGNKQGSDSAKFIYTAVKGNHSIVCKARNEFNAENDWIASDPIALTVTKLCGELIKAVYDPSSKTSTVTGVVGGTADRNTQDNGKLGSNGHYYGVKLTSGSFMAGDVVTVVASLLNGGNNATIYADKTGTTLLGSKEFDAESLSAEITLTTSADVVYLYRKDSGCNPSIASLSVTRPCEDSNDATIKSLTINGVEVEEKEGVFAYTVSAKEDLAQVEVVYTINPLATATPASGFNVTVPAAGDPANTQVITVTAEDGTTQKEYTVSVTKSASLSNDATLKALSVEGFELTPAFDPAVTAYNITKAYSAELPAVGLVTATANDANATVNVAYNELVAHEILVQVLAEDGETAKTYSIVVLSAAAKKDLLEASFSNGANGYIKDGNIKVPYLNGTAEPEFVAAKFWKADGEPSAAVVDGQLVVTGVDASEEKYTIEYVAVTPMEASYDLITFTEVPSYIYSIYGWDENKGIKFSKDVEEASKKRISEGQDRIYIALPAAESVILTGGSTGARPIKVTVNGVVDEKVTSTPKTGETVTIALNQVAANFVGIESNGNSGDAGFTKMQLVKGTSTALDNTEAEGKAVKVVRDGQLLILKNGVLYNAQGAIVK